jgi:hypothetical protein
VTGSEPVERVTKLLDEAGYERLAQPIQVAGIPFEFAAVLSGRSSLDLVVVIDTVLDVDVADINRRVEGLSRALDLVESRRPLTIIVVGPTLTPAMQVALTRVARVLVAGVPGSEDDLRKAIAVLLPLELQSVVEMPESWRSAREKLLAAHPDAADLLEAAKTGPEEVAEAVRQHLLGTQAANTEIP